MKGEAVRNQLTMLASQSAIRVDEAREEVVRAEDADAIDRALDVLAAIYRLRRKELVHDLDIAPSHLSEAVAPTPPPTPRDPDPAKGKKQIHVRWLPAFIRHCPPELREELRNAFLTLFVGVDERLTPEEEAAARDAALEKCGEAGRLALKAQRAEVLARRRRSR